MVTDSFSRRHFLAAAAAVSFAGLSSPRPLWAADAKPADERNAFFDDGKIPSLSLEIAKPDVESLRTDPRKYVKAKLVEDGGKTYVDVAAHLRGSSGSFKKVDEKAGFTLNVDKFEDGQRFHGMEKLHLNNSNQDDTYLSELLVGEMFRAAGVPAAKITHAAVSLNGKKLGFYVLKEGYDKGFLKSHFGGSHGNFYDGGFLKDIDQKLDVSGGKSDVKDQADVKALAEACRENDAKKRYQKIEKLLDLDRFVSYLAVETLTCDWDGYPRQRNNYRLYHDPDKNKITFIPSGMDQMFNDPGHTILPSYSGMVARGVVDFKDGKKKYFARLAELHKDMFVPDRWVERLDELQERVQPAMREANKDQAEHLPERVDRLRNAVRQRAKSIGEQLKREKF